MQILVEHDPTPIVRTMATTLRRAATAPSLNSKLARMRGVATIKSSTDPQSVTLTFDRGTVHVHRGVAVNTDVVIELDLATLNDPTPPKPKITGAARHPMFALALSKVLDPPRGTWAEAADTFWNFASSGSGMPTGMRVVNTDTGDSHQLGDADGGVELHGSAHWLVAVLSGNAILGEEILAGHLNFVGALQHVAVLTGRSIEYTLNGGY